MSAAIEQLKDKVSLVQEGDSGLFSVDIIGERALAIAQLLNVADDNKNLSPDEALSIYSVISNRLSLEKFYQDNAAAFAALAQDSTCHNELF